MPASYTLLQHDRLDDIMDEIGHGRFHIIAVIGLGCRLFVRGSIFSLTTILEPYFKCMYNLSYFAASLYLTSYLICSAISAPLTGWFANRYGKRKALLLFSCMTIVTAIIHVMSSSFLLVVITMSGSGIFENAQYLVYPYLIELLCKSGRKHISIVEIYYVVGWASGVLIGYFCLRYLSWQWAIIFCVILPTIPVLITLAYIPESPRFLLANGDKIGAIKSLVRISLSNNPAGDKATLIRKYGEVLCQPMRGYEHTDNDDCNDDDDDDYDDLSRVPNSVDELSLSADKTTEEASLLDASNFKISNKDLRQRVIVICVLSLMIAVSRNSFLYGSGQSYKKEMSIKQCNQCWTLFQENHLISVISGSSIALVISYNVIGYLRRRLAMRGLMTALAIAILPFYSQLSDWLLSVCFFIASIINDCLLILLLVYCSEVVPSSVRGFANNLMFAFGISGSLIGALMVTYFVHVSRFLTFFCLHSCVLIGLVVAYRYVIETKDMSLN